MLILCGDIESNPGPTSISRVSRSVVSLYSNKNVCNKCGEHVLSKNVDVHKCLKYTGREVNRKVVEQLFERIGELQKENLNLKLKLTDVKGPKSGIIMKTNVSTQTDFQYKTNGSTYKSLTSLNESSQSSLNMNVFPTKNMANTLFLTTSKNSAKKQLATRKLEDDDISIYFENRDDIPKNTIVLKPIISQLIKVSKDFNFIVGDIDIADYDYIIAPLNDSFSNDLGTHWSTLIFDRIHHKFFHIDSIKGYNDTSARELAKRLNECFLLKGNVKIISVDCEQQRNGTDCGYHMLHNINIVCTNLHKNEITKLFTSADYLKPIPVKHYSDQILQLKKLKHNKYKDTKNMNSLVKTSIKFVPKQPKQDLQNKCSSNFSQTQLDSVPAQYEGSKDSASTLKPLLLPREKRPYIKLVADSHGRYLRQKLVDRFNGNYFVQAHISPNARLNNIVNNIEIEAAGLHKNDFLVVVGGTNDIDGHTDVNLLIKKVDEKLETTKNTNIILSSIPYRYDKPFYNKKIRETNNLIKMLSYKHSHVYYLPLHAMNRIDYTHHGLHFNNNGKDKFVSIICEHIMESVNRSTKNKIPVIITERKCFLGQTYQLYDKRIIINQ